MKTMQQYIGNEEMLQLEAASTKEMRNPEKHVSTLHSSESMIQNIDHMVAPCNPDASQKQMSCLPVTLNTTSLLESADNVLLSD